LSFCGPRKLIGEQKPGGTNTAGSQVRRTAGQSRVSGQGLNTAYAEFDRCLLRNAMVIECDFAGAKLMARQGGTARCQVRQMDILLHGKVSGPANVGTARCHTARCQVRQMEIFERSRSFNAARHGQSWVLHKPGVRSGKHKPGVRSGKWTFLNDRGHSMSRGMRCSAQSQRHGLIAIESALDAALLATGRGAPEAPR
jgi:hypothetical protein